MTDKNCIIIHGCTGVDEKTMNAASRTYDKHWMPWIKQELEAKGIPTSIPNMPEPWGPVYEKYKAEFEKLPVNKDTVLVGHSCGCSFLVRWLGESKASIAKLILVAPWKIAGDDADDIHKAFYEFPIDPSIKDRVEQITMFTSNDEEDDGKKSLKLLHDVLGGDIIDLPNHGHYTFGDMDTDRFPELLSQILNN